MRTVSIVLAACALAAFGPALSALAQEVGQDDAGDSFATAGQLHVGVNQCRFDYKLPRAMDVDVWSFTTQPGKVYSVRCTPVDDLTESLAALPRGDWYSPQVVLSSLGFPDYDTWIRGNGNPIVVTLQGLALTDGRPVRYTVEVHEVDDPGDPEGDDLAHAVSLQIGEWYNGSAAAPQADPQPVAYGFAPFTRDVDAFVFPFEDRGVYRIEIETDAESVFAVGPAFRGVATRNTPFVSMAGNGSELAYECRGSGTAWFTLTGNYEDVPSRAYRVRVVRTGTAPLDDHGDTPDTATPLTPGAPATRVNLDALTVVGGAGRIADPDWFAVQTVPGHAYEARVDQAGVGYAGTTLSDVLAEDGSHHADAMAFSHQLAPSTRMLASIRFRGREGAPVKFGLIGQRTALVSVADLGVVADAIGDPLTGPAVLSLSSPTVPGTLENPRDVDSFSIEPPAAAGVYRVNYSVQWLGGTNPGFAPGYALTAGGTRTGSFHIDSGSVSLTRRTDGQADSFPARLDMLCKAWPSPDYPASGPPVHYTLTFQYAGPLPVTPVDPSLSPDDAPSGAAGAQVLTVGQTASFARQGAADEADAVVLPLLAGHVYRMQSDFSGGEIVSPMGQVVRPTLVNDDTQERAFVVSQGGLYLQRQRYGRVSPDYFSPPFNFQAGVTDIGVAQDDQPNDAEVRHLSVGTVTGSIDYAGDADRFLLAYDAGGLYRVTVTSAVPFVIVEDQESFYNQRAGTKELYVYFAASPLAQEGKRFAVASTSATRGTYQVTVERVQQLHPDDDLPDAPGQRVPLNPGDSAYVVHDHMLDVDVLEFRVRAGHLYRIDRQLLTQPDAPPELLALSAQVLDESGRQVQDQNILQRMRADADGVWRVEFPNPPLVPERLTVVDDGPGDDDFGSGTATAGHLRLDEPAAGVLERPDDVDGWVIDDFASPPPGMFGRVTVTDTDSGASSAVYFSSVFSVDAFSLTAGVRFPAHYSLLYELAPVAPALPPCAPDLGKAGGRPGRDNRLDNNDFVAFVTYFFTNNAHADLGGPGGTAVPDGWLDNNDFIAFVTLFFGGCP